MSSKYLSIFRNPYIYSIVAKVLMVLVGFLYSIMLARYLGSELRGQLSYITTIANVAVIVCSLGIHQAYPYYKKQKYNSIESIFPRIVILLISLYTICAIFFSLTLRCDNTVKIAILITPVLTCTKLLAYQVMVETPNKKNSCELLSELFELIVIIVCWVAVERSLYVAVLILVTKNILAILYYSRVSRINLHYSKSDLEVLGKFVLFGFIPMVTLLMNTLNYRVDVLMMKGKVTDAQIGVYAVGIQLVEKVWLISDALRDVLFSKLIKDRDSDEVNRVIRICLTACLVVNIILIVLGRQFIILCFGTEYADAYEPLVIVLFGALMMVYYKIIQAYNIVHHRQNRNFIFLSISVISNVLLNIVFIPKWGINGAAFASLVSYILCSVLFVADYKRYTKSSAQDLCLVNRPDILLFKKIFARS